MRYFILILLALFQWASLLAQDVSIGEWKSYTPLRNAISITQNESTIFLANELTIMAINKSDNSVSFLDKSNGLSDSGIKLVSHHPTLDALIVAYTNSNIDLIYEGRVINLNFIKTNTSLSGDRSIINIDFIGGVAYLSTAFGIVELDIQRAEFRNTIFTGIRVNDMAFFENQIWASTDDGIFKYDGSVNANIADFNLWEYMEVGFPPAYSSKALTVFKDHLYLDINGDLYQLQGSVPTLLRDESGYNVVHLNAQSEFLVVGFSCNTGCFSKVYFYNSADEFVEAGDGCVSFNFGAIDVDGVIYYADLFSDLKRSDSVNGPCSQFAFNSPGSNNVSDIEIDGSEIYIASGGRSVIGDNSNLADGVFFNTSGDWINYNQFNVAEWVAAGAERDFIQIKKHPDNGKIYIANYYRGLIEYDQGNWTVYSSDNSSLQEVVGFPGRVRVGSIDIDSEGNVWMTNHLAPRPISVFKTDGTWQSFDIPSTNAVSNITIDAFDNKWITFYGSSQGILVFDQGDFNTNADDRFKTFTASNSQLSTNIVNHIAVDLEGILWAGTAEGVITFECGDGVFEDFCVGTQRIVDVGANRDILLRTENVRTIGIDGGNRKWFGTNNGVFVQSANGEDQVLRFTSDNSPLFANSIVDFGFNYSNGEVFIGSSAGVQSYRSDATLGTSIHGNEAQIYPNPVKPTYDGEIAINGLAQNANVKIADIQGRIVFETQANGGTAIWDGRNFDGKQVVPGVYMVFSTVQNNLGKADTLVGKILMAR